MAHSKDERQGVLQNGENPIIIRSRFLHKTLTSFTHTFMPKAIARQAHNIIKITNFILIFSHKFGIRSLVKKQNMN